MPLTLTNTPPVFQTQAEHAASQQATPASFAELPPVLQSHVQHVRVKLQPGLSPPIAAANGGVDGGAVRGNGNGHIAAGAYEAEGKLWITEKEVTFVSSSSSGFAIDYPSISLHAITRSVPDSLLGDDASASQSACLYCQLDENPDADEDEETGEEEEEAGLRELWIYLPARTASSEVAPIESATTLEGVFDALSYCSSLHPSALGGSGGEDDAMLGHPFVGIGAFGTGVHLQAESDGAFDDAAEENGDEDTEEARQGDGANGELSDTGRRTLQHLESIIDWPEDLQSSEPSESLPSTSATRAARAFQEESPSEPAHTRPSPEPSNALIFASLPSEFFHAPDLARSLLDLLHAYGSLQSYTPLPRLGRAIVVYDDVEAAKVAKQRLDRLLVPFEDAEESDGTERWVQQQQQDVARYRKPGDGAKGGLAMRVYYGPSSSTILTGSDSTSAPLPVPVTDRNFLISPPGSPPVGWEPIVEDPPNKDTLAEDLIRALGTLRDAGGNVKDPRPRNTDGNEEGEAQKGREPPETGDAEDRKSQRVRSAALPPPAVIIPASGQTLNSVPIPGVSLESYDGEDTDDDGQGPTITSGGKTYQGFSISSVKATVDSMRGNRSRSGSNASLLSVEDAQTGLGASAPGTFGKITPTARPPLASEH